MSGQDHEMVMRSPCEVMGQGGHGDISMEATDSVLGARTLQTNGLYPRDQGDIDVTATNRTATACRRTG